LPSLYSEDYISECDWLGCDSGRIQIHDVCTDWTLSSCPIRSRDYLRQFIPTLYVWRESHVVGTISPQMLILAVPLSFIGVSQWRASFSWDLMTKSSMKSSLS